MSEPTGSDLRNIGVSSGDFQSDMETADEIEGMEQAPEEGPEVAGPVGTEAPAAGGAPGGAMPGGPMQI